MATIKRFEDLRIWQEAREICKEIRDYSKGDGFSKDFDLKSQIKRSAGSCMDNIAEGFEREGNKEFRHFLSIAKGSIGETRSQLYRAFDYDYLTAEELENSRLKCEHLSRKLASFMSYLKESSYKGNKFEEPSEHYGIN